MAFSVPSRIGVFFSDYPDALDVYVLENGDAYLNHFYDKALLAAKILGVKLYQVESDLSFAQIYPVLTLKTYSAKALLGSFNKCYCNDKSQNIEFVENLDSIKAAMIAACAAAAVALESITVVPDGDNAQMTITTYQTASFKMGSTELILQV